MNNVADKTENGIIDVIDEFDYSTQNESYNKRFIEWRRNKDNPYAYNLVMNSKESVFVDGQGFVNKSAPAVESEVLGNILYIIGIALLAITVIENVLGGFVVQILSMLGVNIHNSFINSTIYGGCVEIVVFLISITLVKLLVPLTIVKLRFRMPVRLKYHGQLNHPAELIGAIAASLLISAVLSIPSAYTDEARELYTFFKAYNADVSVWGQGEFLVYTIFDVIVVSVVAEALFRGEMFNALRQFGDVYAVIVTSVVSGVIVQDISELPGAIIISAVAAVGMLRSGTIFTAISVRIVYKMYLLAITIIEMNTSEDMFLTRNFFILATFLISVAVSGLIYFRNGRNKRKAFAAGNTYLPLTKKLALACRTVPLASAVIICLLASVLSAVV